MSLRGKFEYGLDSNYALSRGLGRSTAAPATEEKHRILSNRILSGDLDIVTPSD